VGQVFTVIVTVSNTASKGSSALVSLTPTVSAMGTWSTLNLISYTVTAVGSNTLASLSITAGNTATYAIVFSVSQTGQAQATQDTIHVTLRGAFTDSSGFSTGANGVGAVTFNVNVAPADVLTHAQVNEMFLSKNTFYPPAQTLIVSFTVKQSGNATVKIYNVAGELVKTLFNGPVAASGNANQAILYTGNLDPALRWDGSADDGHPVSSGTYLIFLDAPGYHVIKKVNLLR
jgi:hypothetical protein